MAARIPRAHHPTLAADLEGLEQIDQAHVFERSREPGAALAAGVPGNPFLLVPREQHVHPSHQLTHQNRLVQELFDAELQSADELTLILRIHHQHHRDLGELRALLHARHQLEPIFPRQSRVDHGQIGHRNVEFAEGVGHVGGCGDQIALLLQAHLENTNAAGIGINEEDLLFGQRSASGRCGAVRTLLEVQEAQGQLFCPRVDHLARRERSRRTVWAQGSAALGIFRVFEGHR